MYSLTADNNSKPIAVKGTVGFAINSPDWIAVKRGKLTHILYISGKDTVELLNFHSLALTHMICSLSTLRYYISQPTSGPSQSLDECKEDETLQCTCKQTGTGTDGPASSPSIGPTSSPSNAKVSGILGMNIRVPLSL